MGVELGQAHAGKNMRVYAIGDVHGCLAELKTMLKRIALDLKERAIKKHRIIFLGDYTDRGPDSFGVLEFLSDLVVSDPTVTCLFGNHDEKLLMAHSPQNHEKTAKFLQYGGAETLRSYGFSKKEIKALDDGETSYEKAERFAKLVSERVPKKHKKFLKAAPRSTSEGDYFFCHAGIRPNIPLDKQDPHDLVWIREPFLSHSKAFKKVIVHGHTRQTRVDVRPNRINVDTSCCYGGDLTAVVLEKREHRFIKVAAAENYW